MYFLSFPFLPISRKKKKKKVAVANSSFMRRESNRFHTSIEFSVRHSNYGWWDCCAISRLGDILSPLLSKMQRVKKETLRRRKRTPGTKIENYYTMVSTLRDWQCVRAISEVKFQLTQDIFDALIPAGQLGYLSFMDEGLIGIAGVVSSLMGGYTQWLKTQWRSQYVLCRCWYIFLVCHQSKFSITKCVSFKSIPELP